MYDTDGKPVARYHLEHAWPSKLEIGTFKAGSSEVLMETVTSCPSASSACRHNKGFLQDD